MEVIRSKFLRIAVMLALAGMTVLGSCEDKISVVVMKPALPTDSLQFCQNTIETQYQSFRNLKINGKSEVRAVPVPADGHPQQVTRQEYEHAKNLNIRDFAQFELRDGVLYGLSKTGETVLLFPQDRKPDKNSPTVLGEMYKIGIEGQSPQPKSKEKQNLSLQSVWKIFNLESNTQPEAALYLHVAQENKAAFWKGYLKNVSEYKLPEALAGLRDTLYQCVNDSLASFAGGNYSALKEAKAEALEAKGVDDSPATQALIARVEAEERNLADLISQSSALLQNGKWDESLDTLSPLKKYAGQMPEYDSAYAAANQKSYDFHLQAAKTHLQHSALPDALKEYETALARIPDSPEAQSGRKETLVRKTVADSRQLRQHKKSGEAREQIRALISAEQSVAEDTRISAELKLASCEFSAQMLADSQKLVLAPTKKLKPLATDAAEKAFVEAKDKLDTARDACPSTAISGLYDQVRRHLSDFHLEQARKAQARGALGSALLYGRTAMVYAPESAAGPMVEEISRAMQDKIRIHVGILFQDATSGGSCQNEVSQFAQAVQSELSSGYELLDENQTKALIQIPQSQRPLNQVLIVGQVQYCSIQRATRDQPIPSRYQVHNPDFENAQSAEQSAEQQYKSCRASYGEAACGSARSNFESVKAQRRNVQEWLKYNYTYTGRLTTLNGSMAVSLQLVTASGPVRFGPFQQQIKDHCLEEIGVRDDDETKSGIFGAVSGALSQFVDARTNNHCPLSEDEQYKAGMQQTIGQNIGMTVPQQLAKVPEEYLKRARAAGNPQIAIDNYVMFLLVSPSKGSAESLEAVKFIKTHESDLQPELLTP